MKSSLLILLGALIALSCARHNNTEYNQSSVIPTIDLSDSNQKSVPQIKKNHPDGFGPQGEETGTENYGIKKEESVAPFALLLGPGVYRSLGHISLLKELELRRRKPHIIGGHGLSAVIAAYFAFGYEPAYIEWVFFEFLNKAKDDQVFSENWLKHCEDILLRKLKDKNIEQAKLTLFIPIYQLKNQQVQYQLRGSLVKALMANLDQRNLLKLDWGPAFTQEYINRKWLHGLGAKKIIATDLISTGITWKKGDGLLNGIFEKAASLLLEKEKGSHDYLIYPIQDYRLDDNVNVSTLIFESNKFIKKSIPEIFTTEEQEKL